MSVSAVLLKGSAAAFSASFGAANKADVTKAQLDEAKKSVQLQQRQLDALEKLGESNVVLDIAK